MLSPTGLVSLLDTIGRTPLLRLWTRVWPQTRPRVEIYAKAEFQNPGGSVKDRAAAAILRDAERSGRLQPGGTILDATSGNTGIAYAMIAAARGYRLKLCVPGTSPPERLRTLRAYGAELVLTEPDGGHRRRDPRSAAAARRSDPIDTSTPISTTTTPTGGRTTTRPAVEILEQTDGRVTHFVAGLGHERHVRRHGTAAARIPHDIKLISVQPDSPLNGDRGAEAHGDGDSARASTIRSLADEDVRDLDRARVCVDAAAGDAKKGCSSACRAARRWRRRSTSRRASARA